MPRKTRDALAGQGQGGREDGISGNAPPERDEKERREREEQERKEAERRRSV